MTCAGNRHVNEVHEVKSVPPYWQEVASRQKLLEVRLNDRDYRVGDILIMREYEPPPPAAEGGPSPAWGGKYTGRVAIALISHMVEGQAEFDPDFRVPAGYVLLSVQLIGTVGSKKLVPPVPGQGLA